MSTFAVSVPRTLLDRIKAWISGHFVFRSLGARLTVQFTALFVLGMLIVAAALSVLVARTLSSQIETELGATGAVFDRLWQQRANELEVAGALLAHDFGFREAVATGDEATMRSALENVRARARVQTAFIIGIDGRIHGLTDSALRSDITALWDALDAGRNVGVAVLGGRSHQLVAAPILSPQPTGWLVLASDIDSPRMAALERVSPVPLHAEVYVRSGAGWQASTNRDRVPASVFDKLPSGLFDFSGPGVDALALAKPIPTFDVKRPALLVLTYSKSLAFAERRALLTALALLALLGIVAVGTVTWRSARRITQPLARLDEAAARIAEGGRERVAVDGEDELARLGRTFNRMASEIEERERRIAHLAFNDTLTGLPNRVLFHEQLALAMRNNEVGKGVAVHCLDLDRFKFVNDTLGHPAGDQLLIEVAQRLSDVAQGHFVARLSGDEFVVLQQFGDDPGTVERLARAILEAVAQPCRLEGQRIEPSTSIGISLFPADGADPATLMRNADLALYRAKENCRGTFAYFEAALNERAQHRRRIEADLGNAIREGQFAMHYQPLFDLATNAISSFEALIRWHHPERGLISPAEFIPIAEETGLIVPIGDWALQTACRTAATWPGNVRVAVNVSSVQFHRGGLSERVLQALTASGLPPERLEIELTESVFLEGDEATLATLHRLRALGVRIALDDFGTGYSSLCLLRTFQFDRLKLDRELIGNLETDPTSRAVFDAAVTMALRIGAEVVAEGVSELSLVEPVQLAGCTHLQGYHYSRPVEASEVTRYYARDKAKRDAA
jgi:diguanylate cyclase (GGDEF)-like protein